jgi:hypothetical protein
MSFSLSTGGKVKLLGDITLQDICSLASKSPKRIRVASAFCKEAAFSAFAQRSIAESSSTIVVRWRFDDLICSVSDLSVYKIAQELRWNLFINNSLHAKCYIFDNDYVVGSSNLTLGGFPIEPKGGNTELSVHLNGVCDELNSWYDNLVNTSVRMDDELFELINLDIDEYHQTFGNKKSSRRGYSPRVNDAIALRKGAAMLYMADLPWSNSPSILTEEPDSDNAKHDAALLALNSPPTLKEIRDGFRTLPAYKWLLSQILEPIFFGDLSTRLHGALHDVPPPYRRDVKVLTANLLNWATTLCPEEVKTDKPRHSTRIYKNTD